jgi:hypothetical protein
MAISAANSFVSHMRQAKQHISGRFNRARQQFPVYETSDKLRHQHHAVSKLE